MRRKEDVGCLSSFDFPSLSLQPFKSCLVEAAGRTFAFFYTGKGKAQLRLLKSLRVCLNSSGFLQTGFLWHDVDE